MHSDGICRKLFAANIGDLRKLIENKKFSHTHFNDEQIENIFCEVLLATHYIHSKGVLHRDIKASNVFLSKSNQVMRLLV